MAQVPINQKLYAMVVFQAKQKYRVYPSPGASHWVHARYLELGGKFIDTSEERQKKEIVKRMLEKRRFEHHAHGHHDPRHVNKKYHGKHHEDR
jgi:hypothetical protein